MNGYLTQAAPHRKTNRLGRASRLLYLKRGDSFNRLYLQGLFVNNDANRELFGHKLCIIYPSQKI